jgi:hypothetical protein
VKRKKTAIRIAGEALAQAIDRGIKGTEYESILWWLPGTTRLVASMLADGGEAG